MCLDGRQLHIQNCKITATLTRNDTLLHHSFLPILDRGVKAKLLLQRLLHYVEGENKLFHVVKKNHRSHAEKMGVASFCWVETAVCTGGQHCYVGASNFVLKDFN